MKKLWLIAFFYTLGTLAIAQEKIQFSPNLNYNSKYLDFSLSSKAEDIFYSIKLGSASCKSFPVELKAGTLSYSGVYSSLTNPGSSSYISPFSNITIESENLSSSIANSSKPFSINIGISFSNKENILQKTRIDLVYTPHKNPYSQILFINLKNLIKPNNKIKFSTSLAAGLIPLQENLFDIWYNDSEYFSQTSQATAIIQGSAEYTPTPKKNIKISELTKIKLYTQPVFSSGKIFQQDFLFKINNTNLWTDFIFSPDKLIVSSKNIEPFFQFKTGLNKSFGTDIGICAIGTSALFLNNFYDEEETLKETAGIKLTNQNFSCQTSFSLYETLNENRLNLTQASLCLKASVNFQDFTPSGSFNFYYIPQNQTVEEKLNIKISYYNNFSFSISNSLDLYQKKGVFTKGEYDLSLYSKFYLKKISCTCKLSAAWKF